MMRAARPAMPLFLCSLLLLSHYASSFSPSSLPPQRRRTQHRYGLCALSDGSAANELQQPVVIALTREQGKNEKLRKQLTEQLERDNLLDDKVEVVELPCIAHADGPDLDRLGDVLTKQQWDYVAITSPEAARVLATAWKEDAFTPHPPPKVAVVGKATEAALNSAGVPVAFCPTKATAKVLVQELPAISSEETTSSTTETATTVLYPASAKAAQTLQDGLTARGFAVTRLDTYDTVTATWTPQQQAVAAKTQIVCVASPSSIKGWLANTATTNTEDTGSKPFFLAACIGETSAQACRDLGFSEDQIFYPEKPGIPGWVGAIQGALESLSSTPEHPVTDPAVTSI